MANSPIPPLSETDKWHMTENMRRHGGGFVQALAQCFVRADAENTRRLCEAFPEYVAQYRPNGTKFPDQGEI